MLIMMVVIFIFSQMPGDESGQTSGKLLEEVVRIVENITKHGMSDTAIDNLHWVIRKLAHFCEFGAFGITIVYAFVNLISQRWFLFVLSEVIAFVYALSDEFHQHFIPGRYMSMGDVLIDSSGALLGIIFSFIWLKILLKRRKKHEKV